MNRFIKIPNWNAHKTINDNQGTDFREIKKLHGKVSELRFTVIPKSSFWRAGFKLTDPNGDILPLRSTNSLLFHLGSTPSQDEYGYTAYLNGEPIQELNKRKIYPLDRVFRIKLEINHNNSLEVYVNDIVEFKPNWYLENPNIREKVGLVAWGDENQYSIDFKSICAGDWKDVKAKEQIQHESKKKSYTSQLSDDKSVSDIKKEETKTSWYKNSISIDEGKAYIDEESGLTVGANYILSRNYSNLTITFPGRSSEEFKDVKSGKRFNYRGKNGSNYILTIVEIMPNSILVRIDQD